MVALEGGFFPVDNRSAIGDLIEVNFEANAIAGSFWM